MVLDGFGLIIRLKGCNLEVGNDVFSGRIYFFLFFKFQFSLLGFKLIILEFEDVINYLMNLLLIFLSTGSCLP